MKRPLLWALALGILAPAIACAQLGDVPDAAKLVQASAPPLRIAAGGTAEAVVTLHILKSWHVNANPAANENAIATEVEIATGLGVTAGKVKYPAPKIVRFSFDPAPMFVWDGDATVRVRLVAVANAAPGAHTLKGTVRFQSCNDQICLPPASVKFDVTIEVIAGGAASGGTPSSSGFTTAPPPGASTAPRAGGPLADILERGGFAAFLALFLIGLALNLTPCVYPMIGVTVSIFGARRAAPPAQVIGSALLYVLGMATMYSVLGLVAAFTGGLFGGALQIPAVQVAIGLLLIALSLSMFGLYEITVPPALLQRVGGANVSSAAGIFASGLGVGIIAAPCIGAPVVALLAVVGAKGDPWFGFTSFFTLAMGLGFPYLLLATFSNLIQSLPRSGEWMVWVKKVFGVILLAVGAAYALLALAPKLGAWVAPAALIFGGIYLGFIDKSTSPRAGFRTLKWVSGAAALIAGVLLVVLAPRAGIAFESIAGQNLDHALKSGAPVMLDFSADWCIPCHELDRMTFTDRRVIDAAKGFRAFKVDLTRYDSPESERWRKQYEIHGVPTVVFLAGGAEVRAARVEGFMKAPEFAERVKLVAGAGAAAGR